MKKRRGFREVAPSFLEFKTPFTPMGTSSVRIGSHPVFPLAVASGDVQVTVMLVGLPGVGLPSPLVLPSYRSPEESNIQRDDGQSQLFEEGNLNNFFTNVMNNC